MKCPSLPQCCRLQCAPAAPLRNALQADRLAPACRGSTTTSWSLQVLSASTTRSNARICRQLGCMCKSTSNADTGKDLSPLAFAEADASPATEAGSSGSRTVFCSSALKEATDSALVMRVMASMARRQLRSMSSLRSTCVRGEGTFTTKGIPEGGRESARHHQHASICAHRQ